MSAIMRLKHVHNLETDSPDDLILAPDSCTIRRFWPHKKGRCTYIYLLTTGCEEGIWQRSEPFDVKHEARMRPD